MTSPAPTRDVVRVANGQGFWGDAPGGPAQLVRSGGIDYLTLDYLAEVTMSILQRMRNRSPDAGYASDFIPLMNDILASCVEQGIRVIANAGGVNPPACVRALEAVVRRLGLDGVVIATVTGDDIFASVGELLTGGHELAHLGSGEPLAKHLEQLRCANVYLGAKGIVEALDGGADIVITGRVADASLTVAPLMYEFDWSWRDYDRIASATVAGHVIECGTQCTGGNFDDWQLVPRMDQIGYPIIEAHRDGRFVVTKAPDTGGMVTMDTVTAQLLYEIGDPRRYLTPDVVADFTSVRLSNDGPDRVMVDGVRGSAPTDTLKVSIGIDDGYRIVAQLTIVGHDAVAKASATADLLFARLGHQGVRFAARDICVEVVGSNALLRGIAAVTTPLEVTLRISVRDGDRENLERLGRELASLLTAGPPGLTGFAGGRPRPSEVVAFWPALIARSSIEPTVDFVRVTA